MIDAMCSVTGEVRPCAIGALMNSTGRRQVEPELCKKLFQQACVC